MELHSVELERKLKLPDPSKAMEAVWKLLKRNRQHLDTPVDAIQVSLGSSPGQTLAARRRAKIEAERAQGNATVTVHALRPSLR